METCEFVPARYILFDLRPTSFLNYIELHVSILSVVYFNSLFNAKRHTANSINLKIYKKIKIKFKKQKQIKNHNKI